MAIENRVLKLKLPMVKNAVTSLHSWNWNRVSVSRYSF
jgi:hypothetical protein